VLEDEVVRYWPDAYTQAVCEAEPGSPLFKAFVDLAQRTEMDRPDAFFAAADVPSVVAERGVSWPELRDGLAVPPAYMTAIRRGWHRLGPRGLALLAEALGVPIAAFFLDAEGRQRLDVGRYRSYRLVAPRVTLLGGG
jgi:hypothetical protein